MNKKESILFAHEIATRIAADALYTPYPRSLHGKAAVDYVMGQLNNALLLEDRSGKQYFDMLVNEARELDPAQLLNDPYLKTIRFAESRSGNFLLTSSVYERGELLQYRMPDLSADTVVPMIGFFPQKVSFPTIYEGNMPWMSVCPSEISSMEKPISAAHGRVLTLGCGLGYYPFMISLKENVSSVTIVERQPEVIELFSKNILPLFPARDKIDIVCADAFDFVSDMPTGRYDQCFADIWEGPQDGAQAYIVLKDLSKRYPSTEFSYWIEDAIRWWLITEFDT